MNLTSLLSAGRRLLRRSNDPFTAADLPTAAQPELRPLAPLAPPLAAPMRPSAPTKRRRSWFGWLMGNSRGTESTRLIQGELLLQKVRPVRNDFRDDEAPASAKGKSRLLWETPRQDAPRDDQDHAWNRLRNRRPDSRLVKAD